MIVVVGLFALEVVVYVHIEEELVTVALILEVRHKQSAVVIVVVVAAAAVLVALEVQLAVPLTLGDLVIEELNLIVTGQGSFVVAVVAADHLVSDKDSVDVELENLRLKIKNKFSISSMTTLFFFNFHVEMCK